MLSAVVRRCFGQDRHSVEEILAALTIEGETGNEWAKKTLQVR
jgi:hypothetical protein